MPQQEVKELLEILQNDFSQGVNAVDDPGDLEEKELADALNVRLTTHKVIEQREGFVEYNTATIGAAVEVRNMFQFRDYSGALIPLAQCNDGKLYKGSTAFPTAGTWSSILTETASAEIAFFDAMWGTLVYVNGVDVPQVWEGTYGKCYGFRKTVDAGVNYRNYDVEVADEDVTTFAPVGGLSTVAANDWILIKARVPKLTGFKVVMTTSVNSEDANLTVEYRSAVSTWTPVSELSDGTKTGAHTLGKSGDVTFTECTIVPDLIDNSYGYFLRVGVSAALSGTVNIKAIYLYYNIQALPSIWDGKFIRPDGFVKTTDGTTYVDYTVEVTDSAKSTVATLGGLTTATGVFYLKAANKFRAAKITMSTTNVNTAASTLSAKYRKNDDTWAALTIVDGTSTGSKTLSQTGLISWSWPADIITTKVDADQIPLWTIQFFVSADLSASVDIAEIEIIQYTVGADTLKPFNNTIYHKNRVFMTGRADALNYLFYSAEFKPDVWTGSDTGYIGIPSGKPITAMHRFYNELFVATDDEIYLLEGYSPPTFGLLKINTGGVGVSGPHSVVSVAKMLYFMHSTGFYRFDGIGVVVVSRPIRLFFDDQESAYYIPTSRFKQIFGRFNRVWSTVEWCVSKGSTQATNNRILIFDVDHEGWWFDDIVASCLLKTETLAYQDLYYHGGYVGKVYQDYTGTNDNGAAISAHITTRAMSVQGAKGWLCMLRFLKAKVGVQPAGSITITYAISETTTLGAFGSISMVASGKSAVVQQYLEPALGTAFQFKFAQATLDVTFKLSEIQIFVTPLRMLEVLS